jgi:hypothetical protein
VRIIVQDHCGDQVQEPPAAPKQQQEYESEADKRRIKAKKLGDTAAHTKYFTVPSTFVEAAFRWRVMTHTRIVRTEDTETQPPYVGL